MRGGHSDCAQPPTTPAVIHPVDVRTRTHQRLAGRDTTHRGRSSERRCSGASEFHTDSAVVEERGPHSSTHSTPCGCAVLRCTDFDDGEVAPFGCEEESGVARPTDRVGGGGVCEEVNDDSEVAPALAAMRAEQFDELTASTSALTGGAVRALTMCRWP